MPIREDWRKEFESIGVEDLRGRVTRSVFNPEKIKQAREWIDEHEHGEERTYGRESSQIARSAKNAAWIAAIAAIIAAVAAIISVLISLGWKP